MDIYKEGVRQKVRIITPSGPLTMEQLYTMDTKDLDALAVSLEVQYNNSRTKSFLDKKTEKNKLLKLHFDIVLDVLQTKYAEEIALQEAREIKEYNQKILGHIADKQDEGLKKKSVKELQGMLR